MFILTSWGENGWRQIFKILMRWNKIMDIVKNKNDLFTNKSIQLVVLQETFMGNCCDKTHQGKSARPVMFMYKTVEG